MKEIRYSNFKKSITYNIKNKTLILIFSFIEFFIIFIHFIDTSIFLISFIQKKDLCENKLSIISPYKLFHKLIYSSNIAFIICILVLSIVFVIDYIIFLFIPKINSKIILMISINLNDIFYSRTFFICVIDIYFYFFFNEGIAKNNYNLCFLSFFVIILITSITFQRISLLCVFTSKDFSYPINSAVKVGDMYIFCLKLLISFTKNLDDFFQDEYNTITFFFHCIIEVYVITGFILFLFYLFKETVYTIIAIEQIKLRIFFFSFAIFVNLYVIAFYRPSTDKYIFSFIIVGSFILSVLITIKYNPLDICLDTINPNNPGKQILLILHILSLKDKDVYLAMLRERLKIHYLFCQNCKMCREIKIINSKHTEEDFDSYNTLFSNLLQERQKMDKVFHQENQHILDFFVLASQLKKDVNYNFSLHINCKRLLKKYKNENENIYFNLRFLYEHFNENMQILENIQYKQVVLFDVLLEKLQGAITTVLGKLNSIITITPDDIVKFSGELEEMEKLQKHLNDRDNMQCYPLVLLRIVHEEILNIPVNKIEGSLRNTKNFSDDFLSFHFHEDKMMIMSINLFSKKYLITRTGGNLLSYLNKEISKMFPDVFQEFAIQEFSKVINNEEVHKVFRFIIKKAVDDSNYFPFTYVFYLSPGLKEDDFCLIGEYEVGSAEVIITELQKKLLDKREEQIFWAGKDTSKLIFGNKDISTKKEKGIFRSSLNVTKVFSKAPSSTSSHYALNGKNQNISCKLFMEFDIHEKTYKIFFVKCKNNLSNIHFKGTRDPGDSENFDSQLLQTNIGKNFKGGGTLWIDDTSSINTTSTASMASKHLTTGKITLQNGLVKNKNYEKYYKRFVNSKFFMVLFSILVIGFNIFSLFQELSTNSNIIDLYNIYTNLRSANRLYYTLLSSMFAVVCIGNLNDETCMSYYNNFCNQQQVKMGYTINVYDYIIKDNQLQLDEFIQRVQQLKKNLFVINDSYSSSIFNQDFIYKIISILDEQIHIIEQKTTFSNALEILINSIHSIVDDDNYHKRPIYFFSGYPEKNFENIKNIHNLTKSQIEYYNCFINYNSYLLTWVHIQRNMYQLIGNKLNRFDIVSNYLMVISFLLHISLGTMLLFYLYSFYRLIVLNIEKILRRMKNPKKKEFFLQKYELLDQMCKLYKTHPLLLVKKMDSLHKTYNTANKKLKKEGEAQAKEKLLLLNSNSSRKSKKEYLFEGKIYFELLSPFFFGLGIIFSYYVFIFILFLFLWRTKINATKTIVKIVQSVSDAESSGFNSLSLALLMVMTNQTEKMLGEQLEYSGDHYVSDSLLSSVQIWYEYEKNKGDLILSIDNYFEPTCENFYKETNDSNLYLISLQDPSVNYMEGLIDVCNKNYYFNKTDEKIFTQGVYYNLLQYIKNFKVGDYETYLVKIREPVLFNIFNMEFLLFKPLRAWINEIVYNQGIKKASSGETMILIVYLVLNNITEICLLTIIYLVFVRKIKNMNEKIERVISVFSIASS